MKYIVPNEFDITYTNKENTSITLHMRRFRAEDIPRIHRAWSNPQCYRYNSFDWNYDEIMSICEYDWPNERGQYFMVAERDGQIVATCRFGSYHDEDMPDYWNFGYTVFRSDDKDDYTLDDIRRTYENGGLVRDNANWGQGYGQAMVTAIIDQADKCGITKIISGADIRNYGSIKVMIKNGLTYHDTEVGNEPNDADVDYNFVLDRTNNPTPPSQEDIDAEWSRHLTRLETDLVKYSDNLTKCDYLHKHKCILYFLFAKINKMNKSKCNNSLQTDLENTIKNLTDDELSGLIHILNMRENDWRNYIHKAPYKLKNH